MSQSCHKEAIISDRVQGILIIVVSDFGFFFKNKGIGFSENLKVDVFWSGNIRNSRKLYKSEK